VVCSRRRRTLLVDHVDALRAAFAAAQSVQPFVVMETRP
jgi:hypothetical protein